MEENIMGKVLGGLLGLETPEAPKAPMKTQDQLTAEQTLKQDAFNQKAKANRKASAIQASLTQEALTGGLGTGTITQNAESKLQDELAPISNTRVGKLILSKRMSQLSGKK